MHRNAVGAINRATLIGEKFRPSPLKCLGVAASGLEAPFMKRGRDRVAELPVFRNPGRLDDAARCRWSEAQHGQVHRPGGLARRGKFKLCSSGGRAAEFKFRLPDVIRSSMNPKF